MNFWLDTRLKMLNLRLKMLERFSIILAAVTSRVNAESSSQTEQYSHLSLAVCEPSERLAYGPQRGGSASGLAPICAATSSHELRLRRSGYTRCECERESASRAAPRGAPAFAHRLSVDHVEVSQERRFARRRRELRQAITSDERALRSSAPIRHSSPSSSRESISPHSDESK
ncbi:unnamed protein product [Trichogramma brassicae]|uniref:Uncharacterized protein n=1 Tax=Trichogramma brassicae TaxID=86971 RepID=A0A6H5IID3_9HYME|nr:unnamed protein product [Trichogramma brassicae]